MSRTEELLAEIEKVQKEINNTNLLMKTPPTHYGEDFTRNLQERGGYLAARLAPQVSKALQSGRIDEIVIGGAVLGVAWVGAYAIDGIAGMLSVSKAKKILLSYYEELGVKQNMLIDEQQKLIEKIELENDLKDSEIQEDKNRLKLLTIQLKRISQILMERSV